MTILLAICALLATAAAGFLYVSREKIREELGNARQKIAVFEHSSEEIKALREEFLTSAKAAMFETSRQASSQLLEQHKQETKAAREQTEANIGKITAPLLEQVNKVVQNVTVLQDKSGRAQERTDTLWRALTSPSGAGNFAEIGLENALKGFGFEAGRDYIMQYAIPGSRQRPDAIIFLPHNRVMVIDSKASKFLMDIASAKDAESEARAVAQLRDTMQKHLKDLISREYAEGIQESYRASGKGAQVSGIITVMHLPTVSAAEQLLRADPDFMAKLQKAGIILTTPTTLFSPLSLAQHEIGIAQQAEGQKAIAEGVRELMDSVITVLKYADKVGSGIKSAAKNFDDFARSANSRMLPKMRQLVSLGLKPNKAADMPARIVSYEMRASDDMLTIEGDAEETAVIENFAKKKVSA